MYYQKLTNKAKGDLLNNLIKMKNNIEEGKNPYGNNESRKMILDWKKFLQFPLDKKVKIRAEWNKYYEEVKETPIYALYQEQCEALRSKDYARVKELGLQAKQMRQDEVYVLERPISTDLWEYNRGWVKAYQDCEVKIKELKLDLNELVIEEQEAWGGVTFHAS